ncbi:MAG: hypothetical protein ACRDDF_00195 [Aeromonas sp.]
MKIAMEQKKRGSDRGGAIPPRQYVCRRRIRITKDTSLKQKNVVNQDMVATSAPNYGFKRNQLKVSSQMGRIPYINPRSKRDRLQSLMKRVDKDPYSMFDGYQPSKTAKAEIPQFPVGENFSQPGKEGKSSAGERTDLAERPDKEALLQGAKSKDTLCNAMESTPMVIGCHSPQGRIDWSMTKVNKPKRANVKVNKKYSRINILDTIDSGPIIDSVLLRVVEILSDPNVLEIFINSLYEYPMENINEKIKEVRELISSLQRVERSLSEDQKGGDREKAVSTHNQPARPGQLTRAANKAAAPRPSQPINGAPCTRPSQPKNGAISGTRKGKNPNVAAKKMDRVERLLAGESQTDGRLTICQVKTLKPIQRISDVKLILESACAFKRGEISSIVRVSGNYHVALLLEKGVHRSLECGGRMPNLLEFTPMCLKEAQNSIHVLLLLSSLGITCKDARHDFKRKSKSLSNLLVSNNWSEINRLFIFQKTSTEFVTEPANMQ